MCVQQNFDSILLENFGDLFADVGVLAAQQLASGVDDGHATAEAPEHLPELQPDITAAQNQQVLGHRVQLHDGSAV